MTPGPELDTPPRDPGPPPRTTLPEDTPWRRLDKRMLLLQPVQAVIEFLPLIIVVLVAGTASKNTGWWNHPAIVVVPIVIGIWSWATTWYRITPEQLILKRGILKRTQLTARLDRIRTVDVTASLLQRLLGVASVKVGTGSETPFTLAGLSAREAQALRAELLHAARDQRRDELANGHLGAAGTDPGADDEVEIARFSPSWIRFAPFTLTGLVAVLAAAGFLSQFADDLGASVLESDAGHAATDYVLGLTLTMLVVQGTALMLVVLILASIVTYVLRFWGYRLTRHPRGTLGVRRGLLTTRETTVEERRLRGVTLERPLLLRLVSAARADALVTGLSGDADTDSSSSDMLVPPAPQVEVMRIVTAVLGDDTPFQASLRRHGPAARRRRHSRVLMSAAVAASAAAAGIWWFELSVVVYAVPALLLIVAPIIGEARYRVLGHALTSDHLVSRAGLFPEHTSVVLASAIIGWNISETFFQRRLGLVTLAATIAAGDDSVEIIDLPLADAEVLIRAATPGLAEQFMRSR